MNWPAIQVRAIWFGVGLATAFSTMAALFGQKGFL
jgi:hypothetical protein